ncbi:MAG: DNA polymerase III subunit beta [Rickettsiales bacterium]|nr:MAG: DNA polymerase III subunit beta [Rickettsiales bacterium]
MTENVKNNFEITITTKDLLHALGFANSVVEKRNVLSELSNIKLVAKNNVLEIGATDMDLYLNQEIGAVVICGGQTTVSTNTLLEIVRKISDVSIKIIQQTDSDKLEIIGSKCRFELLTLPATQFPVMEDVDSLINLSVPCTKLIKVIEYTNFSMSTEETRYNLNGIYMHVNGQNFSSVSTDGHRLSVANIELNSNIDEVGVIVPRKTVTELLKIIKDSKNSQSDIQIILSTTKIKFKCNNIVLISKLIDGTFPEYSSFIPSENTSKLTINTKVLADMIDRVATVTIDKFRAIKLFINEKSLKITASGEAKGAAFEEINHNDASEYSGDEVAIGFNPKYLSDILSAIQEEQVEIYFKDSYSPILIKTSLESKDNFVVMPVKV